MILNRNLNLSSVIVKQKYYLSVLSKKKKKKKPTDRPNPKTMGRVTANKLFIKDGPSFLQSFMHKPFAAIFCFRMTLAISGTMKHFHPCMYH